VKNSPDTASGCLLNDNEQIIIEIKKLMLGSKITQREIAEKLQIKSQGLTKLLAKKNFGCEDADKILSAMGYNLIVDFQPNS
jgi:predicted XRE-type DNA-binding protein